MAQRRKKRSAASDGPAESRAADALTVGWLLAAMTAGLCEAGAAAAFALRGLGPGAELAISYLFFAALVVGGLSLLLLAGAFVTRRVSPPLGITVIGLAIGAGPLVMLLVQLAARR